MSVPSTFLGQVFVRKLLAFAGNSLILYDYLITFSLEVAYIWNAPWTFVKAGFLANRYGNLIGQTFIMLEETGYLSHGSRKFCAAFDIFGAVFIFFSQESIRILVLLRAWVVWGCKRGAAILLITLYLIHIIAVGVIIAFALKGDHSLQFEYLDEIGICFTRIPPYTWLIWFGALSVDGVALSIVCRSLFKLTKESRSLRRSLLVRLLLRDAFLFYFTSLLVGVSSIICLTIFRQDPRNFIQVVFSYPLTSIVGQRLVLNLRRLQVGPSPHDRSQEVDRRMAATDGFEQSSELEGGEGVQLRRLNDGDAERAS